MASVKSSIRRLIKPVLFRILGERGYEYAQFRAKLRDIKGKLVEEPELVLFPDFIGLHDEVLDIGANFAYHTHRMAKICQQGTVHAFEPIPFTYRVCKRLIDHFRLTNVKLYQLGVGRREETVIFRVPVVDFGAMSTGQAHMAQRNNELEGKAKYYNFESAVEFPCKVVAIDSFLPQLTNLRFIKMDIEGAEYFALQGMRDTLRRFCPVIMMEISPFYLKGFGIAEIELRNFAVELNYNFYRFDAAKKLLFPWDERPFEEANYFLLTPESASQYAQLIDR